MSKVPEHDPVMGHPDEKSLDFTGVDIRVPMFAYVSREKRPGFDHNKKAGAMNSMVRASAILSNGPFILNLDCDHYIFNSRALKEGMCFMLDRGGDRVCYIQFPQRFEGIDPSDRYANHNTVFFDGNLIFHKCLVLKCGLQLQLRLQYKDFRCICFGIIIAIVAVSLAFAYIFSSIKVYCIIAI